MLETKEIEHGIYGSSNSILLNANFKHLKFAKTNQEFVVILEDNENYEILKGYGKSIIDAINDLHQNLI